MMMISFFYISLLLFVSTSLNAAFSKPEALSSSYSNKPDAGIDHFGNSISVWEESNGATAIIKSRGAPYGGTWSDSYAISTPGIDARMPKLAVNPQGDAVCVWIGYDGANYIVQGSYCTFPARWSDPQNLSMPGENAQDPKVVMDPMGKAIVVWSRNGVVQVASLTSDKVWIAPIDISPRGIDSLNPQVAMDSLGNAVVVFQVRNDKQQIYASRHFHRKEWQPSVAISDVNSDSYHPQILIDSYGDAHAFWESSNENRTSIQSAILEYGHTWSNPITISSHAEEPFGVAVAQDRFATITAVWSNRRASDVIIQSARLKKEQHWSEPVTISNSHGYAYNPKIAIDGNENAIVSWDVSLEKGVAIQVAICRNGVHWSEPINISNAMESSTSPVLSVNPQGAAIMLWNNLTKTCIEATNWFPQAIVSYVTPDYSYIQGGGVVEITGYHFVNVKHVLFGDKKILNFKVLSPTMLLAKVPPSPKGKTLVSVITNSGPSKNAESSTFRYTIPRRPKKPSKFYGVIKKRKQDKSLKNTPLLIGWKKSSSYDVHSYNIYFDKKLLQTIRSTDPLTYNKEFKGIKKINKKLYVTAVAASGLESKPTRLRRVKKDNRGFKKNHGNRILLSF